jgi:hypothetical protein
MNMPTGSDKIAEQTYNHSQSWNYDLIVVSSGVRYRVEIRRNAYDFQSWAKVSRWDGTKWHPVYNEPIESCRCKSISYVERDVQHDVFRPDALRLLETAIAINGKEIQQ